MAGVAGAITILRRPEGLRVPLWLALVACAAFVLAGLAFSLKSTRYRRSYHGSVVLLLLCMAAIPAWLTFGRGVGACTASLPLIGGPLGCRVAFGISTVFMVWFLVLAVREAVRSDR